MDCYFHSNVPSIARCAHCGKAVCATCRDESGGCPSCRLAAKVEAATAPRTQLGGQVPPRPQAAVRQVSVTAPPDPVESRALVSLGYPLWPLALLSLLDRKQSRDLRRQAFKAIGFNVGFFAFWAVLSLIAQVPFLGFSAWVLVPLLLPLFHRQRLLRHQDVEWRGRTHPGREQLARRPPASGRRERAVAIQKRASRLLVIHDGRRIRVLTE